MRQLLLRAQTYAADRWSFVEHPRLYRAPMRRQRDITGQVLKVGLFGVAMWMIWAPVLAVIAFVAIALIG